uniref:F-box/FBD/LRR-repeat protein At1g13570-like n=1 Tax=Fragaria vesca subsp. vesca TaxID=101020 RepID=UPI0005CA9638|nr:PREDICTED: F-box/FBD/LRR-repeat protein At1g13570-like [Fragaria vesca subsp. vesca]
MIQILSRLTLKEAVRTSILSSKWRYKSAMLPVLVFDGRCVSKTTGSHTTIVNIVDHVLLAHIDPVEKFLPSYRFDKLSSRDIDRWVLHLSRNSVKQIMLDNRKAPLYKLPSCFFSCQDMTRLDLCHCMLIPPPTFQGFKSLKQLDIDDVTMAQDVFEQLIVCCPLLKALTCISCDGFSHIKINAPKLHFLHVGGPFEDINLENTVNLVEVIIITGTTNHKPSVGSSCNLVKFVDQLPHVKRLTIGFDFLEYLAVNIGDLPRELPTSCLHLNFLSIDIYFDKEETLTVLCLLRSCPALQELRIRALQAVYHAEVAEDNSWLDHDNHNCSFTQLRIVHMTEVSGVKAELDFIRYLLLNSPVLEIFTVKPASTDVSRDMVKKLLRFGRASVHSEIIYLDP